MNKTGKLFVVTHNYTGYPMMRQAQRHGGKGHARRRFALVQAEYPQDWMTEKTEATGSKQAEWRVDPKRSGAGGAIGDIGTHAYNLACFVSGLKLKQLCAELDQFWRGPQFLTTMCKFLCASRAAPRGMIWASQVAPGNENGLKLRVYGTKGGLEWTQADPNYLWYTPFGKPKQLLTRGGAGASPGSGARHPRSQSGHPEGYLEGLRQYLHRGGASDHRGAQRAKNCRRMSSIRPSRMGLPEWNSLKLR